MLQPELPVRYSPSERYLDNPLTRLHQALHISAFLGSVSQIRPTKGTLLQGRIRKLITGTR